MKKGVSNVIVVIMIVLVVIVLGSIVYVAVKGYFEESSERAGERVQCLKDVEVEVREACLQNSTIPNYVSLTIQNKGDFEYSSKYFKVLVTWKPGVTREVSEFPTRPYLGGEVLGPLSQRELIVDISDPNEIKELTFVPKIREKQGYCYGQSETFEVSKQCY